MEMEVSVQAIAILAPAFEMIAVVLIFLIIVVEKLGKIRAIAYVIGVLSFITSFAYFLRGIFVIGLHFSDLIHNWIAFLLWIVISIIFFTAGLPDKKSKEK